MKPFVMLLAITLFVCLTSVAASANPATLPKHPGYPMDKAIDPVAGKPLANDPGRGNATGNAALMESAAFDDVHAMQSLPSTPAEQEIREKLTAPVPQNAEDAGMTDQQK
ncbi:exported protein of unknown function [Nitrospira japonica]|uniref:Uncharacterized protein n=1 Tax=Nitrospira japonica TaxID=1325564 RepID=A0A1W1I6F7_9BACT|nr:hypothetical protein [Nitrospira japonica]SLM48592.1 exported protein of unknown function [Nitrospira japonica]